MNMYIYLKTGEGGRCVDPIYATEGYNALPSHAIRMEVRGQ